MVRKIYIVLSTIIWAVFFCFSDAQCAPINAVIQSFECGDNCYLTVIDPMGQKISGLCVAKLCRPWNEAAEIAPALIGRRVKVWIGSGQQFNESGNVMATGVTAFNKIELIK